MEAGRLQQAKISRHILMLKLRTMPVGAKGWGPRTIKGAFSREQ